jgi:hypothetical protein
LVGTHDVAGGSGDAVTATVAIGAVGDGLGWVDPGEVGAVLAVGDALGPRSQAMTETRVTIEAAMAMQRFMDLPRRV